MMRDHDNDSHPDVRFLVTNGRFVVLEEYATLHEATLAAFHFGRSNGFAILHIVVHSEAGAHWLDGDDGVRAYRREPDAAWTYEIYVRYRGRKG